MWFDSWNDLARVLLVGPAAYCVLLVALRASGKRTLAKLNAFALVVTIALGSTLSSILLGADVSLAEGTAGFAVLVSLQFLLAALTSRVPGARHLVTAQPALLLRDGRPLPDALRGQRVTIDELRQAARSSGQGDLSHIAAIILETDGSLSVITREHAGDRSALEGVVSIVRI